MTTVLFGSSGLRGMDLFETLSPTFGCSTAPVLLLVFFRGGAGVTGVVAPTSSSAFPFACAVAYAFPLDDPAACSAGTFICFTFPLSSALKCPAIAKALESQRTA